MQYLIYGLAIYGFLQIIIYFVLFKRFYQLTLQYPKYRPKKTAELPNYLPEFFKSSTQELVDFGFKFRTYLEVETTLAGDKCWSVLLYNPDWKTYAFANVSAEPTARNPVNVAFETFFDDGILLLTLNSLAHSVIGKLPATILQDPYAKTIEQQWHIHQAKNIELSAAKKAKVLPPDAFLELLASHESAYINQLFLEKKIIQQPHTNLFNLTIPTAWETALKCKSGVKKHNQILQYKNTSTQQNNQQKYTVEIPLEIEIDAYQRLKQSEKPRKPNNNKLTKIAILFASFVLFALAAKIYFEWQTIAILIGVLLLHELGHFMMMRYCGYEDTAIFFLPFFGAAASGKKEDATLTEKVMVLLGGPIPGLILGTALIIALPEKIQAIANSRIVITWLIGLNWLNLLPILPLDGGRVVNLLIFSRHPYAEIVFKIITIIVLAIASISTSEPILVVLTVFMVLSIPHTFKIAKILKHLSPKLNNDIETNNLLAHIFQAIRTSNYDTLQFDRKYRLVKEIAQRYQEPYASWLTRISLILVYLLCLIGGTLAMRLA